jgi:hypothetical protein
MRRNNLLLILSVLNCLSLLHGTLITEAPMSLSELISNIQNRTNELSDHIEKISVLQAKGFRIVIQNSKSYCIDSDLKKIEYENIERNAKEYQSFLEKSLSKSQRLSSMLTEGLHSGNLVIYYLSEKMYSDAAAVVDEWQQSFTSLKNELHLFNGSPLERIILSSDVFNKTSLNEGITQFILTLAFLFCSCMLAYLVYRAFSLFDTKNTNEDQNQTNTAEPLITDSNETLKHSGQKTASDKRVGNATGSLHRYLLCLLLIIFLAISNLLIYWRLPNFVFVPEPKVFCCCPEAIKTINNMVFDNEYLKSSLENKIASIVEIRKHLLIYEDETVQKELGDLYENIGTAFQNGNNQIAQLYTSSRNAVTTFDRLYPLIENEARETGRLAEAEPLLKDIKLLSGRFQLLAKSSKTMLVKQRELLPILKKQTLEMQSFLHQGHFEIGKFIGYHQDVLIDIEGSIQNVRVIINDVIEIADGNKGYGLTIESLEKVLESDQFKAQVTGFISAGASGSVIFMVGKAVLFTSLVASPVGMVALGGAAIGGVIGTVMSIDSYNKASNFIRELNILEVERKNVLTALDSYDKSLNSQKEAIEENIKSLGLIKTAIGRFNSKVDTLILPRELLEHIDAEITKIITEYNNMIGFIKIFEDDDTMRLE